MLCHPRREGDQDGWWPVSSEVYRRGEVFGVECGVFASCYLHSPKPTHWVELQNSHQVTSEIFYAQLDLVTLLMLQKFGWQMLRCVKCVK